MIESEASFLLEMCSTLSILQKMKISRGSLSFISEVAKDLTRNFFPFHDQKQVLLCLEMLKRLLIMILKHSDV